MLGRCAQEQIDLSLPSLRVGSIDDEIMQRMSDLRRTGCTLAPEAGSQRLRDVINKGRHRGAGAAACAEAAGIRLAPGQTLFHDRPAHRDRRGPQGHRRPLPQGARRRGQGQSRLQVTAALSPFVPKPFTPFQWVEQIGQEEIQRRVQLVRDEFRGQKFLKLRWHEPAMSHLEGILSRADRRLADVVEKVYRKGGIFTSWIEGFDLAPGWRPWKNAA